MNNPRVTVLMSVYNGEKYLNEAIDSILSQTYTDFEFLIIDDGSTDRTSDILNSYDDPRIRIVTNKENIGLTKSLNRGLKLSQGEYIARMDADDISLPERFEKQISFLEHHSDVVLVGTAKWIIDKKGNVLYGDTPPLEPSYRNLLNSNQIVHGSVMIRRDILLEYNGYDERFRKCQDYALWLQISKKYRLYNIPQFLYKLRLHDNNISQINDESILYYLLAKRLASSNLSVAGFEEIKSGDLEKFISTLSREELIFYYNSKAGKYRANGNFKAEQREYYKIFSIMPYNIINSFNLVRMFLKIKLLDRLKNHYD